MVVMADRMTKSEEQDVKRNLAFQAYQTARQAYDKRAEDLRVAESNLNHAKSSAREAHADLVKMKKVLDETMTIPLTYGDAVTMGMPTREDPFE